MRKQGICSAAERIVLQQVESAPHGGFGIGDKDGHPLCPRQPQGLEEEGMQVALRAEPDAAKIEQERLAIENARLELSLAEALRCRGVLTDADEESVRKGRRRRGFEAQPVMDRSLGPSLSSLVLDRREESFEISDLAQGKLEDGQRS